MNASSTTNNMENQEYDYNRIASAIDYIHNNFKDQPQLEEVAEAVHLSPYHFQRMFTNWTGISPKKFLQYLTTRFAKDMMKGGNYSISTVTYKAGLSGSSRLHDLFVSIEGMTPGEYNSRGRKLRITYGFYDTFFGQVLIATTSKGICSLFFTNNDENQALTDLMNEWPEALLDRDDQAHIFLVRSIFEKQNAGKDKIRLNIKGTPFQLKVWEALLRIPEGAMASYDQVAEMIWRPKASRAVGSAIGKNPVALLIPCHRVIKKVGGIGNYHWGEQRKRAILTWEHCQTLKDGTNENRTAS